MWLGKQQPYQAGEAQRMKLASELHKSCSTGKSFYILMNRRPHTDDIARLKSSADDGNIVLVDWAHLMLSSTADHNIDLGPVSVEAPSLLQGLRRAAVPKATQDKYLKEKLT